ncbi:possible tyrosine transporter P-protein (TC 2.A.45.2.1) [Geosporobacter subterraneus DSM 17957]|uniref:Possible tyrosine transporter P-protein (TC 2.A.45.2.1) n=1 Tax=Geosporobacter subterraneus DSM 17957 TaxID=1121919 RepID=A0A1M6KT89_9FIRM|nr:ArsB/NhaD family transporter [Geosporobacter subterraneus]SHJ62139.1 possible tyrosine transporter P-protein (TC 2.A.45.2.1) [Geosporobacter subterraneus DSM 17957]
MSGSFNTLLAIGIFVATYGIIISEKINRTTIAFFGAVLMVLFHIIGLDKAIETIDFHTIGLLIGMMIIVNILKRTGIFEYVAIKSAKLTKGDPWRILLMLSGITAISSALLDNVTTVLLIAPVTLVITEALEINPMPLMIAQILSANIGGTATLIGDPPNIMIGSETGLGFMDFIINLAPPVLVIFVVTIFLLKFIFKAQLHVKDELKAKIMDFDEHRALKDKSLMIKSLAVLSITILGFGLHQFIHMETATVALAGASLLLLISKTDPEEIFHEIEWLTIFFFIFLFILVGALEEMGVIESIAKGVINITQGNLLFTGLLILWISGVASAFLDNIPFVATMIPLIQSIGKLSSIDITPLWWALALGACLGGNGTLVGASANVVVAGILEKHRRKISFMEYMKIGFPLMLISIGIATIYMYIFYLM